MYFHFDVRFFGGSTTRIPQELTFNATKKTLCLLQTFDSNQIYGPNPSRYVKENEMKREQRTTQSLVFIESEQIDEMEKR